MKQLLFIIIVVMSVGTASILAQGYDPGLPDTVRIAGTVIPIGASAPVTISIWNDSTIKSFQLGLEISYVDSGYARLDSVHFVGRMSDPSVLSWRITNRKYIDGISPDTLVLAWLGYFDLHLPPGDGPVAEVYFTGSQVGAIDFDTTRFGSNQIGVACTPATSSNIYIPRFIPATCLVSAVTLPPILVLPDEPLFATVTGETVNFAVSASSPQGFPVQLVLSGLKSADDSTLVPLELPLFDEAGQFTWTPSAVDVGIWVAAFQAQDSSGLTSTAQVEIQVVSEARFLTELSAYENPTSLAATGLAHGDFDRDGIQEIAVPAAALRNDQSFGVFHYEQTGVLRETLLWHEGAYDRGIAVSLLDDDEFLDAVYIHNAHLRVLRGDGVLFEVEDRLQAQTPLFRDASLLDFDGDEHLDYMCASLFGATVYRGADDAQFGDLFWFLEGDSVLSISGADFNQDGYDDLAVGTADGVKVYLSDAHGSHIEGEFYPQVYGAVDVEVTSRGSDFNNDGLFDLCLATPSVGGTHSELVIYLGRGDGTFQPVLVRQVQGQISASRPGDFNGDGLLDLAFVNGARKYVGVVFGDGAGGFLNELRFPVPRCTPRRMDCLDIDLDGDLDLVIAAYDVGAGIEAALLVYLNQTDPQDIQPTRLEIQAANNVDMQLLTPRGGCLSRVTNSTASGELYPTSLDDNAYLDILAVSSTVESGRYEIVASPRKNLAVEETFSLVYKVDSEQYRIAVNQPSGEYVFPLYPGSDSPVSPKQGEYVDRALPTFTWPSSGTDRFELATDLTFDNIIESATVSSGVYTLQVILPTSDSTAYFWRVRPDEGGSENIVYAFNAVQSPTDVEDGDSENLLPGQCRLAQNYPNPFNPLTNIKYYLPYGDHVTITVHNVLGQAIRTLIDQVMPSGEHSVEWDATDQSGRPVASGIYFYRMAAGQVSYTRKMTLIR